MLPESFDDVSDAIGAHAQVLSEKAQQTLLVERGRTQFMIQTMKDPVFQKEVKVEVYGYMLTQYGVKKPKNDYIIDFDVAEPVAEEGEV